MTPALRRRLVSKATWRPDSSSGMNRQSDLVLQVEPAGADDDSSAADTGDGAAAREHHPLFSVSVSSVLTSASVFLL